MPMRVTLTRCNSRENFYPLIDSVRCIDMKLPIFNSLDNIRPQHQIAEVGLGCQHALVAVDPLQSTDVIEAFVLLVDTADGLDLAVLIDRTGDRDALVNSNFRKTREYGV